MFGHERFETYQISIKFLKVAINLADTIPTGYSMVKDQLKRAALSIPLNIAEGSGKSSIADKKRFYAIARGSVLKALRWNALLFVMF
jgi:four helix bundle protein